MCVKNKKYKTIIGGFIFLFAFMFFGLNVFADTCSAEKTEYNCNKGNQNGFKCKWGYATKNDEIHGKKSCVVDYTKCVEGYKSNGNGCYVEEKESKKLCADITFDKYGRAQDEVCNKAYDYLHIGGSLKTISCKYKQGSDGKYACLPHKTESGEDIIYDERYALAGASADINAGDELFIVYCNSSQCFYNEVNDKPYSGWVNRNKLTTGKTEPTKNDKTDTKNIYCSNSNSSGVAALKKHLGKDTVSSEECNKTSLTSWYSIWQNNCCYVTARNTGTDTGTNKTITFNGNGGYSEKYSCPTYTSATGAGICSGSVKSGTTVSFPPNANYKEFTKSGEGAFIGWSKSVNCEAGNIDKTSKSVKVSSNLTYTACFKEVFNDDRAVLAGAINGVNCGASIHITYCKKNTDGSEVCFYDKLDGKAVSGQIDRNKLAKDYNDVGCTKANSDTTTADKGDRWVKDNSSDYSCGDILYVTTCSDTECKYTKVNGNSVGTKTVKRDYLDDNENDAKKACNEIEEEESEFDKLKKCSNKTLPGMTGTSTYEDFCYKEIDNEDNYNEELLEAISKVYECSTGTIQRVYNLDREQTCNKYGYCVNDIEVTCSGSKPTLTVSSGVVQGEKGVITVRAKATEGEITSYYASPYYIAPTDLSDGWMPVSNDTFTIESAPGIQYIWVRDSEGNISSAVRGAVLDTVNSNTTVQKLELHDANGIIQTPSRVSYNDEYVKSSKYVMMSNDLNNDSKVLADGFNPYDMEYKLEVSSPTVSVYATLTSTDSNYVEGYEPRTVNLNYGVNTILIKIINKEGVTRTYTILVTRTDDRTSDNTLSNITLSAGKINFNANVTDYKIEIPKSTTNVNVNSVIGSDKASYVSGYVPGNVSITGDTTVKLIKVKSETGSTRTYVLTFVKEGTDLISDESLQLLDLVVSKAKIPFESSVANYSMSVDYETDLIDIYTTLKNKDSYTSISVKRKNDASYSIVSGEGLSLDVGENFVEIKVVNGNGDASYYRLTIIRKEFGLEISNDTTLKDLKVLGYDIGFEPNKKEYTVKIKQEKSLVVTAVPSSNRAEVFIRGNEELTGFSTVRVKVVAEDGEYETYSIDIKKDAFNKTIEIASIVAGVVIILVGSAIIIVKKKSKANREYFEE